MEPTIRIAFTKVPVKKDQGWILSSLGDRVVVVNDGVVQQVAPPAELYQHPANVFVGRFIGAPTMNLIRGKWRAGDLYVNDHRVVINVRTTLPRVGDVLIGARAEHVKIVSASQTRTRSRVPSGGPP